MAETMGWGAVCHNAHGPQGDLALLLQHLAMEPACNLLEPEACMYHEQNLTGSRHPSCLTFLILCKDRPVLVVLWLFPVLCLEGKTPPNTPNQQCLRP